MYRDQKQNIHEFASSIRRSIAGDLEAKERYLQMGDAKRASECDDSIRYWQETLKKRLSK